LKQKLVINDVHLINFEINCKTKKVKNAVKQ